MTDLERAKALLIRENHTCVMCHRDTVLTTELRGVRPLVRWLETGTDARDYSAADRVVGKATAYLYVLLGVRAVYARVMSQSALAVLERHGITAEYDSLADHIINRAGDGVCPFEAAVLDIHDPNEARRAILSKMERMGIPF
ncbi:MAG: DUF1893 domain-containing protein [Oscillospiraceae bacterium]|nr:DUF1893 domain-containing protein [Oscillospiraceae bacterium]